MSTLQYKRLPRLTAPKAPGGEVHLEPPPEIPRATPGNMIQKFLPVVMILASVGMMAFMFTRAKDNPFMMMMPMMMIMSTFGMMASGFRGGAGQQKAEMNEDRKDYLRYLGQMRERAREAAEEQRVAREWVHPDPQTLWSIAKSRRLWERRTSDQDFCHLRVARGAQRLETRLVPPQTGPVEELEPITTLSLRRFVRAHSLVSDLPIATSLRGFAAVGLQGDKDLCRGLARSMIAQLATFHSPEDTLLAVVSSGRSREEWEWVKWLPHVQHPTLTDGIGPQRMLTGSLRSMEEMLAAELADRPRFQRNAQPPEGKPHIVILLDDPEVTRDEQIIFEGGMAGVTLIDLSDVLGNLTARRGMRMVLEPGRIGARSANGVEWFGAADFLSVAEATALARQMSPYRSVGKQAETEVGGGTEPFKSSLHYIEQLGLSGDPMSFDLNDAWRPRSLPERFRVAIGPGEYGDIVHLDIKETGAPYNGMGPHGLCIGSTGSGKSEFLRTIVTGLLATHPSTALNFVLVDFKGGATFNGFERVPHVSAVITNLQSDLAQVDRMKDALAGELDRRQQVLYDAGVQNVWEYEEKRQAGAELIPLPALFVVIDEFTELLTVKPEFAELFSQIGRLGRSMQVHLLLASQKLDEGRLRGLETHLSYRIALKTFNPSDSRSAIGIPDAAELPSSGGHGFLKHPNGMERFRAAYVSGWYQPRGRQAFVQASPVTGEKRPRFFIADYVEPLAVEEPAEPVQQEPEPQQEEKRFTDVQVVLNRVTGQGPPAHQVWLPPLDIPPTLDALLPPLAVTEDRGYHAVGYAGSGRLQVPMGLIDMPYHQRQEHMLIDLSGAYGHGAIVGGPQAGKSNVLRTLIASMALTHTPYEVQFYCIDLGGGTMAALRNLPHVGGFGSRRDPDTVRRTIAELKMLLAEREGRFQELGVDSMADFRNRKRRGEVKDDPYGDVFLMIDGWGNFRNDFDNLEQDVMWLANQGLTYGIHVFVTGNRWAEIRPALKDLLGTKLELRLGDPSESEIARRVAQNVPAGRPGRGLHPEQLHFLIGLPRVDSENLAGRQQWEQYNEDLSDGVVDLVNRVRSSWRGRPAPQVRLLPELFPYEQLPSAEQQPHPKLIPIGINEEGLKPVYLNFYAEPNFYAFGERGSGKTSLLRSIVRGITTRYTPDEAQILMVDYRRTMLGFLPTDSPYLLEYTVSSNQLQGNVKEIVAALKKRIPGPDVTQDQLKNRSWWKGPELFLVVDDYDLVAPSSSHPLADLAEFIPMAADVGLHVIIVRNSGGASRATFEPLISKMREASSPGLAMSANKDDGQLIGNIRSRQLPVGRGYLVSRSFKDGYQLIQTAFIDQG